MTVIENKCALSDRFFKCICTICQVDLMQLPKIQISNLLSFDIQRKSSGQNVFAHFLSIEMRVCPANSVKSLRKVPLSEHGFE